MKLTKEFILENSHWRSEITQQILDDYEKARKWDSLFELGLFKLNNEKKIVASLEVAKQNQKLRELIEKRIEEIEEGQSTLYNANLMEGWDINKKITLPELQNLLKESKK